MWYETDLLGRTNSLKHFRIRRGDRPPADAVPTGAIEEAGGVKSVAILGEDWPGLRPHMEVEIGTHVTRGQTLFTDRKHREVAFVAPISGVVDSLTYGSRRMLDALIIRVEPETEPDLKPSSERVRNALLGAGFWPSFRTRPFGLIPGPDERPEAIFVNAVQATPQAPDPVNVLYGHRDEFRQGCEALTQLTKGVVHVCQSPGVRLGPEHERVLHASFSGTVAGGLVGTQIDCISPGRSVWSLGYQDVAAMGYYLSTGVYRSDRIISLTGPVLSRPRLLRVPLGARIADLVEASHARTMCGTPGAAREAAFLGRFDEQIILSPGVALERGRAHQRRKTGHRASIPSRALERSVAVNVLPIPLLRALSVGDAAAAERLGCCALIEEDLAAATRVCTSGVDYGARLRSVLRQLGEEAA